MGQVAVVALGAVVAANYCYSAAVNIEIAPAENTAAVVVESYLVDENLKGDLYYLETQNYLAYIDCNNYFGASFGFGRRRVSHRY